MKDFYEEIKKNTTLKTFQFREFDNGLSKWILEYIFSQSNLSNLSLENFSLIFDDLPKEMNLKKLKLEGKNSSKILDLIKLNINLKELHLSNSEIPKLISSINTLKYLESLSLINMKIENNEVNDILDLIRANESITVLHLNCVKFKQGELAKALNENFTLKILSIPTWDIEYSFSNNNLEELSICDYQFNQKDLKKFLNQVKESKLKILNIELPVDHSIEIFKEFLHSNPKLENLNITIKEKEFQSDFFKCLYSNTHLSIFCYKGKYRMIINLKKSIVDELFLYNYSLKYLLASFNESECVNSLDEYLIRNRINEETIKFNILSTIKISNIYFHFKN